MRCCAVDVAPGINKGHSRGCLKDMHCLRCCLRGCPVPLMNTKTTGYYMCKHVTENCSRCCLRGCLMAAAAIQLLFSSCAEMR